MKFVLSYTPRSGGSVIERVEGGEAAQKLLANWSPSNAGTIHQWVTRCDGNGGFSVIETDDAEELFKDLATWSPWLEFEVYPVLDITTAVPIEESARATARSVL